MLSFRSVWVCEGSWSCLSWGSCSLVAWVEVANGCGSFWYSWTEGLDLETLAHWCTCSVVILFNERLVMFLQMKERESDCFKLDNVTSLFSPLVVSWLVGIDFQYGWYLARDANTIVDSGWLEISSSFKLTRLKLSCDWLDLRDSTSTVCTLYFVPYNVRTDSDSFEL